MTQDIRWLQRFDNYQRALGQLSSAVELSRQRALSDLEKQGVIQTFEFVHELAWNVLKDFLEHETLADSLLQTIMENTARVEQADVYGSRATGNFRPGSDIDLTPVGSALTQADLSELAQALDDSDLPYQLDLSLRSNIDNPHLLAHTTRVGVVLYERQPAPG